MPFFTVEMDGMPTAVTGGQDGDEIRSLLDEEAIRADWIVLGAMDEGSTMTVRHAAEDERLIWHRKAAQAIAEGDLDEHGEAEDENYIVFLVPVSDPTDELDPEDDDG